MSTRVRKQKRSSQDHYAHEQIAAYGMAIERSIIEHGYEYKYSAARHLNIKRPKKLPYKVFRDMKLRVQHAEEATLSVMTLRYQATTLLTVKTANAIYYYIIVFDTIGSQVFIYELDRDKHTTKIGASFDVFTMNSMCTFATGFSMADKRAFKSSDADTKLERIRVYLVELLSVDDKKLALFTQDEFNVAISGQKEIRSLKYGVHKNMLPYLLRSNLNTNIRGSREVISKLLAFSQYEPRYHNLPFIF